MEWKWNPFWRWPWSSLTGMVVLVGVGLYVSGLPEVSWDVRALLESDLHSQENFERVESLLGDEIVAVVDVDCGDVFSAESIQLIRRLSQALEAQPESLGVKSITHSVRPVRRGLRFEMVPLVSEHASSEELRELKRFCLEHPLVRNVMVSADGRHALILNSYPPTAGHGVFREGFCDALERVLQPFRAEGVVVRVLALPCVEREILSTVRKDAAVFLPLAALLGVGVLVFYFRSIGVVALIGVGSACPLVMLGVAGFLLGWTLDPYSLLLLPLLGAVHLALQTHCYAAWQRAGLGVTETREALENGLREVFRPALFALLTTAIGLLSLVSSPVSVVRWFGLWGALGVGMVLFSTFGPGVALLLVLPRRWVRAWRGREPAAGRIEAAADSTVRLRRGRRVVAAVLIGAVITAGIGLSRVRTDVRVLEFLNRHSQTRSTIEFLDKTYGGVNILTLEADSGATGGVNGMQFLRFLASVSERALIEPEVTAVYSYDQVMAMANEIWEGGVPGSFRLPADPRLIAAFATAMGGFRLPLLESLVDEQFRTATWIIRTHDLPSARYLGLVDRIVEVAENSRPVGVRLSAARGLHSILESDRRILRSQLWSGLGSLAAIGLTLLILWRSAWLAGLALLMTCLPVALALGGLGYAGIPLNSVTVMVGAVCLGIAVDHSVHFMTHWRNGIRAGASAGEALERTRAHKGGPISVSTAVLTVVFGLMTLCSFPPVAAFGGLAAMAFLMTWVAVLRGVPGWLVSFGPRP